MFNIFFEVLGVKFLVNLFYRLAEIIFLGLNCLSSSKFKKNYKSVRNLISEFKISQKFEHFSSLIKNEEITNFQNKKKSFLRKIAGLIFPGGSGMLYKSMQPDYTYYYNSSLENESNLYFEKYNIERINVIKTIEIVEFYFLINYFHRSIKRKFEKNNFYEYLINEIKLLESFNKYDNKKQYLKSIKRHIEYLLLYLEDEKEKKELIILKDKMTKKIEIMY
jgi:hypothetical protein